MKFKKIAKTTLELRGPGNSPTLYEDENGKLYIQGWNVSSALQADAEVPDGETLVEIDHSLLSEAFKNLKNL